MSLRDTIEGARSEVSMPAAAKTEAEAAPAKKSGGARKSSANAKPAREKAASVRTISKDSKKAAALRSQLPGAKKTKEQKEAERAERRKRREEEDYRNQAFTLLLNQNPDYKKSDRLWWILLGIGFAHVGQQPLPGLGEEVRPRRTDLEIAVLAHEELEIEVRDDIHIEDALEVTGERF